MSSDDPLEQLFEPHQSCHYMGKFVYQQHSEIGRAHV